MKSHGQNTPWTYPSVLFFQFVSAIRPSALASTVENSEGIVCIRPGVAPLVSFAIKNCNLRCIHCHFTNLKAKHAKTQQLQSRRLPQKSRQSSFPDPGPNRGGGGVISRKGGSGSSPYKQKLNQMLMCWYNYQQWQKFCNYNIYRHHDKCFSYIYSIPLIWITLGNGDLNSTNWAIPHKGLRNVLIFYPLWIFKIHGTLWSPKKALILRL